MIHKKDTIVEHIGLEERILSHDKQLVKLETVLERVANNQDKMSASMETLALSMSKLASLEDNNKASFERVHRRIDDEIIVMNEKLGYVEKALNELDLARTFSKYPRVALAVFVVMYLFTIKEFRDVVFVGGN